MDLEYDFHNFREELKDRDSNIKEALIDTVSILVIIVD
jgi:hypothetical protein